MDAVVADDGAQVNFGLGSVSGSVSGADVASVTNVVLLERQGRDRGWWDQMLEAYWPDSSVRLSWYDGDAAGFVAGSKAMAERGAVALHHIFAPVARIRGDRAHVEASVAMRIETEVDGVAGDLVSYTRLNYRLERRDGVWRILSLASVYEYATLTPQVPGQVIEVSVEELSKFRASYALLVWNVARQGRPVSDSELGDDRPEEVAAFYAEIREWLNAG